MSTQSDPLLHDPRPSQAPPGEVLSPDYGPARLAAREAVASAPALGWEDYRAIARDSRAARRSGAAGALRSSADVAGLAP